MMLQNFMLLILRWRILVLPGYEPIPGYDEKQERIPSVF